MWWAKKNTEPHKKAFRFEVTAKYFAICGRFHVFDQVNVPENFNWEKKNNTTNTHSPVTVATSTTQLTQEIL